MASFAKSADFTLLLLTACFIVLAHSADPKLHIYPPNQNPIVTPAKVSFGLMCEGKAEEGEFTDMKWFNPLGEEIRGNVRKINSMLKLTFPRPGVEDSGNYKCTALFSNTLTLEAEVQVDFYESIKFEECPEVQNLVVGQAGRITCRAVANPRPQISWEKDGSPIISDRSPDSPDRITINDFGLAIPSVGQEDGGMYSLEAFVKETGSNEVKKIKVNVLTPPKINDLPEEFVVIQGEEYTITCGAVGSQPLNYTWYDHKDRNLNSMAGFTVIDGSLTISKVERDAGGSYMCKVSNPAGTDQAYVKIEVQVRPTIIQMENITIEEGKEATFQCLGQGIPKPVMSIRRDNSDEDIIDSPELGIELEVFADGDVNRLRLNITKVKRSHDGLYFCKASNAAGVAERTGHLQVQFRPDMSRTQVTSVKTWSDNPANLSCIAEAIPNATITWKFQGEPIELDDRVKVFGGESYSSLLVMIANRPDYEVFGTYTCEARNGLGENSVAITLDKASRPSALTQIVFDKVTSTTITFRLMGPGNTGGMPITHYNMKYKLADQKDDPVKEETWEKDAPYILSNLIPRAKYQFSAAAINVVGVGDYKEAIYVMPEETVPEPPIIKTRQETISEYPDRFEVRWDIPNNNGKPILKYGIRYFKVERGLKEWTQVEKAVERNVDADFLNFVMSGLMPDSYYKIEIRATNEIGNSLPESVVIKTSKGETNDGHTSLPDEELPIAIIIAIVLVALFITLVILDVTCFFRYHCGLLYLMRYRTCGRSPEKVQASMEEGRACKGKKRTEDNKYVKNPFEETPMIAIRG